MVEYRLPKPWVAGSNPVTRSIAENGCLKNLDILYLVKYVTRVDGSCFFMPGFSKMTKFVQLSYLKYNKLTHLQ